MIALVVPAIRTIPGVESFEYELTPGSSLEPGDVVWIPFRKRNIPALVVKISETAEFNGKLKTLEATEPLLRLGADAPTLLERLASHAFASRPSVLQAWLRTVPKRAMEQSGELRVMSGETDEIHATVSRYLLDRLNEPGGVKDELANDGRVLVVTPWIARAELVSKQFSVIKLTGDETPTAAFKALQSFLMDPHAKLVTTRIGAWLAIVADRVVIEEPENDDHKQDELQPRYDARWLVMAAKSIRPELAVVAIGTTPRLGAMPKADTVHETIPAIPLAPTFDAWSRNSRSDVEGLSSEALRRVVEAAEDGRQAIIVHPTAGERGRIRCRDCGWVAPCPTCGFALTLELRGARCHRCGRKTEAPLECGSCGGNELSGGRIGAEALHRKILASTGFTVPVITPSSFDALTLERHATIIVTDASSLGGAGEDIRRTERLVIGWRRFAAKSALADASVLVQGPSDVLESLHAWLDEPGVRATYAVELGERELFHYPPAVTLIKFLATVMPGELPGLLLELETNLGPGWTVRGPFSIPYRAAHQAPRAVIHLTPPAAFTESEIITKLSPFKNRGFIDLDPVAFYR